MPANVQLQIKLVSCTHCHIRAVAQPGRTATSEQWRSQDLVSGGAQPISPFFHSLSPLPSVLYHPPISLFILPARLPFPIALPSHKCSGRSGGTVSSPSRSGRNPAAKQFLVHFPFYTVTPHSIFVGCYCFNHG